VKEKLRYTQIEFPSYRFIPGENSHPTENPLGHSYGKETPELTTFDPGQWRKNEQYLYGVDLYNHGYWWESHEAFEGLWRVTARGDIARDYLQGLIKISGAFIKWHLKKRQGLEYLYKGAMDHLLKVGKGHSHYMGVNIPAQINKLEKHFSMVVNFPGEWPDLTANYPDIILELADKG
jgi:hypothetical protein